MSGYPPGTAAEENLACCHVCLGLAPVEEGHCSLCGSRLHLRIPGSIERTVALLITAALLYVPANVLPIMTTEQLGRPLDSTILGGVAESFDPRLLWDRSGAEDE
jgi:paraquat-inducible protein A